MKIAFILNLCVNTPHKRKQNEPIKMQQENPNPKPKQQQQKKNKKGKTPMYLDSIKLLNTKEI